MNKIFTITDGPTAAVKVLTALEDVDPLTVNRELTLLIAGTFSGATASIELAPTSTGPWVAVSDGQVTEDAVLVAPITLEMWVRGNESGGDGSTSIDVWAG